MFCFLCCSGNLEKFQISCDFFQKEILRSSSRNSLLAPPLPLWQIYFSCSVVKQVCLFHPKLWSEQNYPPKQPQRWRFFTLGKPRNIISERAFYEDILHGTLSTGFLITAFLHCLILWHKRRQYESLLQSSWKTWGDPSLILPLLFSYHCIHWPLTLHRKRSPQLSG